MTETNAIGPKLIAGTFSTNMLEPVHVGTFRSEAAALARVGELLGDKGYAKEGFIVSESPNGWRVTKYPEKFWGSVEYNDSDLKARTGDGFNTSSRMYVVDHDRKAAPMKYDAHIKAWRVDRAGVKPLDVLVTKLVADENRAPEIVGRPAGAKPQDEVSKPKTLATPELPKQAAETGASVAKAKPTREQNDRYSYEDNVKALKLLGASGDLAAKLPKKREQADRAASLAGAQVEELQAWGKTLGIYHKRADGIAGEATQAMIAAFTAKAGEHGITETKDYATAFQYAAGYVAANKGATLDDALAAYFPKAAGEAPRADASKSDSVAQRTGKVTDDATVAESYVTKLSSAELAAIGKDTKKLDAFVGTYSRVNETDSYQSTKSISHVLSRFGELGLAEQQPVIGALAQRLATAQNGQERKALGDLVNSLIGNYMSAAEDNNHSFKAGELKLLHDSAGTLPGGLGAKYLERIMDRAYRSGEEGGKFVGELYKGQAKAIETQVALGIDKGGMLSKDAFIVGLLSATGETWKSFDTKTLDVMRSELGTVWGKNSSSERKLAKAVDMERVERFLARASAPVLTDIQAVLAKTTGVGVFSRESATAEFDQKMSGAVAPGLFADLKRQHLDGPFFETYGANARALEKSLANILSAHVAEHPELRPSDAQALAHAAGLLARGLLKARDEKDEIPSN
ncbi:MAG: hypothetical protein AAB426_03720 [Myxococcota bacterium]